MLIEKEREFQSVRGPRRNSFHVVEFINYGGPERAAEKEPFSGMSAATSQE